MRFSNDQYYDGDDVFMWADITGKSFVAATSGEYCYDCCTDAASCDEAQCSTHALCDNGESCCKAE